MVCTPGCVLDASAESAAVGRGTIATRGTGCGRRLWGATDGSNVEFADGEIDREDRAHGARSELGECMCSVAQRGKLWLPLQVAGRGSQNDEALYCGHGLGGVSAVCNSQRCEAKKMRWMRRRKKIWTRDDEAAGEL